MPDKHRILIVEDSDDDAQLLVRELRRGGLDALTRRVETIAGTHTIALPAAEPPTIQRSDAA
jgi:hypothetical protein